MTLESGVFTRAESRLIWIRIVKRMLDPFHLECFERVAEERVQSKTKTNG
jgi:hypothetical protein